MIKIGIGQEQLAREMEITQAALSRILSGKAEPHKSTATKLLKLLYLTEIETRGNSHEISRKKLLLYMWNKFGMYSTYDSYIFGRDEDFKLTNFRHLVTYFEPDLNTLALEPNEPNTVKFCKSEVILHCLRRNLDYAFIINNESRAYLSLDKFHSYVKNCLKIFAAEDINPLLINQYSIGSLKLNGARLQLYKDTLRQANIKYEYLINKPIETIGDYSVLKSMLDELRIDPKLILKV